MKRISFILLTALISLCSCESVLEKTPDGQITLDKVLSIMAVVGGYLMQLMVRFIWEEIISVLYIIP